jgi:hypothetical protein
MSSVKFLCTFTQSFTRSLSFSRILYNSENKFGVALGPEVVVVGPEVVVVGPEVVADVPEVAFTLTMLIRRGLGARARSRAFGVLPGARAELRVPTVPTPGTIEVPGVEDVAPGVLGVVLAAVVEVEKVLEEVVVVPRYIGVYDDPELGSSAFVSVLFFKNMKPITSNIIMNIRITIIFYMLIKKERVSFIKIPTV